MSSLRMTARNYLIFFTVLCLSLHLGVAIKCYQCISGIDKRCADDDLDKAWSYECNNKTGRAGRIKYTVCRKITQWVDFELEGLSASERIVRLCGIDDKKYVNECYYRGGYGARQNVCTCDSDECNSATAVSGTQAPILITAAAILYRRLF